MKRCELELMIKKELELQSSEELDWLKADKLIDLFLKLGFEPPMTHKIHVSTGKVIQNGRNLER